MSRWGEEEKKTKGLIGFAFALFVLVTVSVTFFKNYANLEQRRELEAKIQKIVHAEANKNEQEIAGIIITAAAELGAALTHKDIDLQKTRDEYGNPVFDVRIDFPFEIDLLVTTYETSIPIVMNMTLLSF